MAPRPDVAASPRLLPAAAFFSFPDTVAEAELVALVAAASPRLDVALAVLFETKLLLVAVLK